MKLYSYFRSSAAFRVRIALNLKGLVAEIVPIHLLRNGGEQHSDRYRQINPSELVPSLVDENFTLSQSMSILEYLEETDQNIPLLPQDIQQRALIRAFCQSIACDIHPLNNLRVLQYLQQTLHISDAQKSSWYRYWIEQGMQALEAQLVQSEAAFCFGNQPTLADCCLIPQVYNAKRFNIDLSAYPKVDAIYQHCLTLPAFQQASPEAQTDAN